MEEADEGREGKLQRCDRTYPRLSRTPEAPGRRIRVYSVPDQCQIE